MRARSDVAALAGACLCLSLLGACERVVPIEVPAESPRLVVEGRIESPRNGAPDIPRIRISTTQPYFEDRPATPVTGAVVLLRDGTGPPIPLVAGAAGEYVGAPLTVVPDRVYSLEITWGGEEFVAVDTAADVAPIDSLYFTPLAASPNERRATLSFRDVPGRPDRYLWDQWVDGVRLRGPTASLRFRPIASDIGIEGSAVSGFAPFHSVAIPLGATVRVRQQGISRTTFDFFVMLNDQLARDGWPFSQLPASVKGNVRNRTTPARRPSGYFSVGRYDERTLVRTR